MMIHPDVLVDMARQHTAELLNDAAQSRLGRAARRSRRAAAKVGTETTAAARRPAGSGMLGPVGTLAACAPAAAE